MKKLISITVVLFLLLATTQTAQAHRGWGRCYRPAYRGYYAPRPIMPYPPAYIAPAPVCREIWIAPHWRRTQWGDEWIPGHWRRQRAY